MLPGVSTAPLRRGYDTVIVGAGVQGLAIAYELAKRGHRDVLVVDKGWPGGGASGRNGELIRSGFASAQWCNFFELSRKKWLTLSAELDMNVLFNRTGYVVLASTEEQWERCRTDQRFQLQLGIHTELLDEHEARQQLPAVNPDMVRGGIVQEQAGFAHHDSVVAAYLLNAARLGVQVVGNTEVVGVIRDGDSVRGVRFASGDDVRATTVVNAAGGAAPVINDMVNVNAGLTQARLEMIVTQSLKPFLRPGLAALELLGYCHQTGRGEFVGGTELPRADVTTSLNGSWPLLRDMATKFVRLIPLLAGAKLLRHWAGTVSQTRDLAPVLGPVSEVPGFVVSAGWVYGFMGAPAAGELLAEYITTGTIDSRMAPFKIERIESNEWIREGSLVVEADYDEEGAQ